MRTMATLTCDMRLIEINPYHLLSVYYFQLSDFTVPLYLETYL